MKKLILVAILSFVFTLSACTNAEPTQTATAVIAEVIATNTAVSPTNTASPSPTLSPTQTPPSTPTQTPPPTATNTSTPIPTPTASIRVLAGTAVPQPGHPISPDNVIQLTELARWGRGVINDIDLSGNGRWIAVATATGVYIHDAHNIAETLKWIPTSEPVNKVAYSPDSSLLTIVLPSEIQIWDTSTVTLANKISERAKDVKFSPDNQYLAILSQSHEYLYGVQIWSIKGEEIVSSFNETTTVAFHPNQPIIAVAYNDRNWVHIGLYELSGWQLVNEFTIEKGGYGESIASMAFTKDGQNLIVGRGFYGEREDAGQIEVRQVEDGKLIYQIDSVPPYPLKPFLCDSDFVSYEGAHFPSPTQIEISPNGGSFSVQHDEGGTYGTTVTTYRLSDGQLQHRFINGTNSSAYSPDGLSIITGSEDGKLSLWQESDFTLQQTVTDYNTPISGIFYSPNSQFVGTESKFSVQLLNAHDGTLVKDYPTAAKLAFSSDNTRFALGYKDGRIDVYDATNEALLYSITMQTSAIEHLAFTPDSQHLLAVAQDCTKHRYQAIDGTFVNSLEDFSAEVDPVGETRLQIGSMAISHDNNYLIGDFIGSSQFGIWQLDQGTLKGVYPQEEIMGAWNFVSVPDENAFAGLGGTYSLSAFSLWDMNDGTLLVEGEKPDRGNYYYDHLAVSSQGNLLSTSSSQGTIDLWATDTQEMVMNAFIDTFVYKGDFFYSVPLAFSLDGNYLAAGTSDGLIYLWGIP